MNLDTCSELDFNTILTFFLDSFKKYADLIGKIIVYND